MRLDPYGEVAEADRTFARPSRVLAAIFFLICASTYAINAMDRLIFPAVLRFLSAEFHFPLSIGGLLSTAFLFGTGIAGIATGFVVDRYSRKIAMIVGIVVYSVFTILTPLAFGFMTC